MEIIWKRNTKKTQESNTQHQLPCSSEWDLFLSIRECDVNYLHCIRWEENSILFLYLFCGWSDAYLHFLHRLWHPQQQQHFFFLLIKWIMEFDLNVLKGAEVKDGFRLFPINIPCYFHRWTPTPTPLGLAVPKLF